MKKNIFVVSKFLEVAQNMNKFHFRGYFNGQRVNEILVTGGDFEHGEDYVLALNQVKLKEASLYGVLVKSKRLF